MKIRSVVLDKVINRQRDT